MKKAIDWERVKQQLAQAEQALLRSQSPAHETRRAELEARARALALQTAAAAQRGPGREVVEFMLGSGRFAVAAGVVREVRTLHELTPIPCAPAFVSGMMNAQGRVIAVIDLKTYMALPESGLTDLNKVIILHQGDMEFGILADHIVGGRWLADAELMPGNAPGGPSQHLVQARTQDDVVVLDIEALVRDPGFVVDEEVAP